MTAISGVSGFRMKVISRRWHGSIPPISKAGRLTLSKFDYQGRPHIFLRRPSAAAAAIRLFRGAERSGRTCRSAVSVLSDRPEQRHATGRTQPGQDRPCVFQGGRASDPRARRAVYAKPLSPPRQRERADLIPLFGVSGLCRTVRRISNPGWRKPPARGCTGILFSPERAEFADGAHDHQRGPQRLRRSAGL